jgi:hypothetical protein
VPLAAWRNRPQQWLGAATSSRREEQASEPVDERLLSGRSKVAADVRVADAPETFRVKLHDSAAFRARGRHGGNQADPGARRHQGEDARELVAFKNGIPVIRALRHAASALSPKQCPSRRSSRRSCRSSFKSTLSIDASRCWGGTANRIGSRNNSPRLGFDG